MQRGWKVQCMEGHRGHIGVHRSGEQHMVQRGAGCMNFHRSSLGSSFFGYFSSVLLFAHISQTTLYYLMPFGELVEYFLQSLYSKIKCSILLSVRGVDKKEKKFQNFVNLD